MSSKPVITFTSDFGSREYYVGAVKGVLLASCPQATIVDISHDVGSHDLLEGAFVIASAYSVFPTRTVHLVVVDPTVGSSRRGIVVTTENAYFVAPDNGILSLIYAREPAVRVVSIDADHYFRKPVAPTFHARDVFAPVAAGLARGVDIDNFGAEITDYVRFGLPAVRKTADHTLEGMVLHIDKFGNIITNLSAEEIARATGSAGTIPVAFRINGKEIRSRRHYYSESAVDEIFFLMGSAGYYEIAALKKPAARLLEVRRGNKVELEI
jgi:S-adenosyl-L-methionine hydrolase (adenosine-forming)